MTGEKNKSVSLEKFWKLDDEQLSTPRHDEMVIQLLQMNEDQLKKVLGLKETPWDNNLQGHDYELDIPPRSEVPVLRHRFWNDTGYIIGYWDLVITACRYNWKKKSLSDDVSSSCDTVYFRICIEVKPTIDSFGKVLRQLETYRQYPEYEDLGNTWSPNIREVKTHIYLYTATKAFDQAFESQRIHVIHPQESSS